MPPRPAAPDPKAHADSPTAPCSAAASDSPAGSAVAIDPAARIDPAGDDLGRVLIGQAPWALPATTPESGEWDDLHRLLEASEPFPDFVCMTRALAGSERRLGYRGEPASGGGWHCIARDVIGMHR